MIEFLISRKSTSSVFASFAIRALNHLHRWFKGDDLFDSVSSDRLVSTLQKPVERKFSEKKLKHGKKIDVIVVASEKDFDLLPLVLEGIEVGCKHFSISSIKIVVPRESINNETLIGLSILDKKIEIVDENRVLNVSELRYLFSKSYAGRENWCLQQFLKYFLVLNSVNEFALVVDADTLLLRAIPWVNHEGKFVLMPTVEYQTQYYEVLIKIGIIEHLPEYSFVPHHMFYSVDNFQEMHKRLGEPSPYKFAEMIDEAANSDEKSPFCIDYELYAQFMFKEKRNLIVLLRWANCRLSRAQYSKLKSIPGANKMLKVFFNSISLHSWVR